MVSIKKQVKNNFGKMALTWIQINSGDLVFSTVSHATLKT